MIIMYNANIDDRLNSIKKVTGCVIYNAYSIFFDLSKYT